MSAKPSFTDKCSFDISEGFNDFFGSIETYELQKNNTIFSRIELTKLPYILVH